jgi:sigma-E factor negative regulatory protein RseA
MTDEQRSDISALVDGELDDRQAARLCELAGREPELRTTWERYQLIGQAIRGEAIEPAVRGVADAVREALAGEPAAIVARGVRRRRGAFVAPLAGVALAAGVAFLAAVAVPALFHDPESERGLAPPIDRYASLAAVQPQRWGPDGRDLADKLDLFLVNHQEAAPASGVAGMLPHATLIGYDVGR